MRRFIPLLLIIAALAAGIYFYSRPRLSADTVEATRGQAVRAVYATGVVEPVEWAMLSADKTRRVTAILKDEGAVVQAGDPLVQLDDSVEESQESDARARVKFAGDDLARKRKLLAGGATFKRSVEEAEREHAQAEATLEAAQRERARLLLKAPMAGMVLRREVEPGETIQAGEAAMWVGKPVPLRITAEVDEEDIGIVKLGQQALIKADAFPGQALEGKITEITPKGDPVNKVFRARVGLADNTPLKIGMTTEVNIITEVVENALLIPVASESAGQVWKPGRKPEPVPVKIGIRGENQLQVLEGLSEGDIILRAPPEGKKK